ncbi:uncharacterized protein EI90DRAFT_3120456 [Cantharellus anzutake]|uniref:uncharacterized protein n=1 Tax=Cantharellus anzutake TaxID=1750568 RepID=UPI0019045F92|nr:uncharacterized protein EI90DRAFT_3120456 [Cantharellus anzutake]KAF8335386.1 hypothetical protein EI90DRAFT_3120456 [Cantharellus anzutake]
MSTSTSTSDPPSVSASLALNKNLTAPQQTDLDTILSCIKHHFCFLLATNWLFPNKTERNRLLNLAARHVVFNFPPNDHKLVQGTHLLQISKDKPSAFHDIIKTFTRKCIDKEYGFLPDPCEGNVDLATHLLDVTNFYFQEWEDPGAVYRDVDWESSWEGLTEDQHNQLLPQLIWFAAMVVEHILNLHARGHHNFSATIYHEVYDTHMNEYFDWLNEQHNAQALWKNICAVYQHLRVAPAYKTFQTSRPVRYDTDDM